MAAKRRRRKRPKTYPVLGMVFVALLLVVLPITLISRHNAKETAKPGVSEEQSPIQIPTYEPEDFIWENGLLTCVTQESIPGIDVSYYQGEIDWQQVRQAGIEFAFVRVGFRRSKDGTLGEDSMAKVNLQGAAEAGLQVGAYFFSQATTPEEAREEAEFALEILQDFELDLPLAYDWEKVGSSSRTDGMTRRKLTECIETFCSTVEGAGYETMVYFNREMSRTLLNVKKLNGRPVWFAMYGDCPDAPCQLDYWQYTDEGTVPGIEGYVDLNLYFP